MILYCPRCGNAFPVEFRGEWFSTNQRCLDCGVALSETRAMLAPSDEELEYGLDEWPVADRVALTAAMAADGIPYRWEADIVLVVPEVAEEEVDTLLDELEAQDPEPPSGSEGADGPVGDLDAEAGGTGRADDGGDGGEQAQAAMVELFLAADRLWHSPLDQEVAADLEVAADTVADSLPPYGIHRPVWQKIQQMAATTVTTMDDDAGEETIAENAKSLRNFLRDYV